MKAMLIRAHGGPEVMRLEEVPTPEPGPGEILVKVHAVSVNRTLDITVREGTYGRKVTLPHIVGTDPTGVISAVGPDVTARKVGERVACSQWGRPTDPRGIQMLGVHAWGGYAEYVCLPAEGANGIPDAIDFPTATVIARHGPIAFHQLRTQGELKPGEWVLVMGASGGLGSLAVQAAKHLGANVIAAAGADDRVSQAVSLGADAGINYRTHDLTEEVRRITGGRGVDLVIENIGDPETFPKAFMAIGRFGRLVTAGSHGGGKVMIDVTHLYFNRIRIIGGAGGTATDYADAMAAAAAGKLKGSIDRIMPLSQAAEAQRLVFERKVHGKVILDPTQLQ